MDTSIISESKEKEVESYQLSHGQNAVIIDALFCRAQMHEALVTICDTLRTTPGKEHIAQHILQGTVDSAFRFRLVGDIWLFDMMWWVTFYKLLKVGSISLQLYGSLISTIQYLIAYSMQNRSKAWKILSSHE